jgi:hypothetical protein
VARAATLQVRIPSKTIVLLAVLFYCLQLHNFVWSLTSHTRHFMVKHLAGLLASLTSVLVVHVARIVIVWA